MQSVDLNRINVPQQTRTQMADPARHKGQNSGKSSPVSRESDRVKVSDAASQLGSLVASAKGTDEVRQERVDSLRQLVQSGQYNVPADKIADAILRTEK